MNCNSIAGGNGDDSKSKAKNLYARGADDGFWMGLYFCVLFFSAVVALNNPMLNVLAAALALGVPFLTYAFLRRAYVQMRGVCTFSALWMQGIMMFACGCLIFGAATFVYLRWVDPEFIIRVLKMGVEFYSASDAPSSQAVADEFQMIVDSKSIPSALDVVMGWMWLGVFSGSMVSMLVSIFVRLSKVSKR